LFTGPARTKTEKRRRSAAAGRWLRLLRAHGLVRKIPGPSSLRRHRPWPTQANRHSYGTAGRCRTAYRSGCVECNRRQNARSERTVTHTPLDSLRAYRRRSAGRACWPAHPGYWQNRPQHAPQGDQANVRGFLVPADFSQSARAHGLTSEGRFCISPHIL
jgi:hypothetical protein